MEENSTSGEPTKYKKLLSTKAKNDSSFLQQSFVLLNSDSPLGRGERGHGGDGKSIWMRMAGDNHFWKSEREGELPVIQPPIQKYLYTWSADKGDGFGNINTKAFSLIVGCDLQSSYCRVSIEVCPWFPLEEQMRTHRCHKAVRAENSYVYISMAEDLFRYSSS